MDKRFVSIGRGKWIDRGPVRTLLTRSGKKTGRFGVRKLVGMYDGDLDRWKNRVEGHWYWQPIIMCDSDPNDRKARIDTHGRAASPTHMVSSDYQAMGDAEHEMVGTHGRW